MELELKLNTNIHKIKLLNPKDADKVMADFKAELMPKLAELTRKTMRVGVSSGGTAIKASWPPLSSVYSGVKSKEVGGLPIMQFSQKLVDSIKIRKKGEDYFVGVPRGSVGSDGIDRAVVAMAHEFGFTATTPYGSKNATPVKVPARPFIGPTSKVVFPKIKRMADEEFTKLIQRETAKATEQIDPSRLAK